MALVGQIRRMKNRPDTTLTTAASMNNQNVASGVSPNPATPSRSTVLNSIGEIPATQQSLSGVTGLELLSQLGAVGLAPNALTSLSSSNLGFLTSLAPGSILSSKRNPEAISGKSIGYLKKTPGITKHDSDSEDDDGDGDDE